MSKILIIATSRKTQGGVTSVVKAHEQGDQWEKYNCKWIETHVDRNVLFKLFYFLKSIFIFLFKIPFYHAVHIHFSEPPSAIRKSLFIFIAKILRKKVILHFHSYSIETTLYSNFSWLYRYIFKHGDLCIILSNYWKIELEKFYPAIRNIKVLLNPIVPGKKIQSNKKNYILFAGTLNKRKGYADLLQAFAPICNKYLDWKIVFAGNGEIDNAIKLAKNLNICDQVVMRGWISGKEKEKLFAESSVFCLPSYAEGLPMALLDAWSYGLPSIITSVGGIPDVAIDNENAILCTPGNIKDLSSKLDTLLSDKELQIKLSQASLKLSDGELNINKINNQLDSIYKSCLK
ncbi:glycosyltransferase family 4 protein [Plebeiibacterium sediminum]|uniref:Glycosyltransferase family 4 protein n=1 Tax=Plebeiibacterium sediminum TaxID=2992112 RepID=A0AAE3SEQ9_9BACT|nr:glycosyltransferase family 4 protein [Plebeiobacterium sediminum]MCW3786645.1 glycosyltransferase family 4 protein [Plebeiobacterium sediminum]